MGYLKVPYVQELTPEGMRTMDLYSRLLSERMVMLTGEVNDDIADLITSQLFYLEYQDRDKDIRFWYQ